MGAGLDSRCDATAIGTGEADAACVRRRSPIVATVTLMLALWAPTPATATTASNVICSGCISSTDIAASTIVGGDVRDGSLQGKEITSGTITDLQIGAGAVKAGELATGAVGADEIAAGAVGSSEIADGSIAMADLAFTPATLAAVGAMLGGAPYSGRTVTTASADGLSTAVLIGSDGLPAIAYSDATSGDLMLAHCEDPACASLTTQVVDDNAASYPPDGTSIALGADGFPVLSYRDSAFEDLWVAHCTDVECSGADTTKVDDSGNVGPGTSIAVGTSGYAYIAYTDDAANDLVVARCTNTACTASSTTVQATGDDDGHFPSLVLNADGVPLVAYGNVTGGGISTTTCTTTSCAAFTAPSATIAGTQVDASISMTTTADGLGLVAYSTGADTKVALCANDACTSIADTQTVAASQSSRTYVTASVDGAVAVAFRTTAATSTVQLATGSCSPTACSLLDTPAASAGAGDHYASVAFGTDGLPIVASRSVTASDLAVRHCTNRRCIPYYRAR